MSYITPYQYYTNGGVLPTDANWGSYQYVSLSDIINNFMAIYVGNDKQVNNVKRYEAIFHAKQAIKKLNYDAMRSIKTVEMYVDDSLKMILPSDYVNYVRISLNSNGLLRPLHENRRANSAAGYLQDNNNDLIFDSNGEVMVGQSKLDFYRLTQSTYTGSGIYNGSLGWNIDGVWYFGYNVGSRYGLDTSEANALPSFRINNGVIDFSSDIANNHVVIEYISDGMENGDDSAIEVNKFAEDYVYAYIKWALLNNKIGINDYEKQRCKKEKEAEYRNARIRLSNIHPSRLLMTLRGRDKIIK